MTVEKIKLDCFHYDSGCCRLTPGGACKFRLTGSCFRLESVKSVEERGWSRALGKGCPIDATKRK